MKSIVVREKGSIIFKEGTIPEIKDEKDILVKVKAVGICGSDIHIYNGSNPLATYPRVIGHEVSGEVIKAGKEVKKVKKGDKVAIDPVSSCGVCYACRSGNKNVCKELKVMGVHVDGGMQEYLVVDEDRIHKFNSDISFEEGAMIEPFTIAAQSTFKGDIREGDSVFVMGAGPIGLAILQVAKVKGAKVIISDLNSYRLKIAKELGADETINPQNESIEEKVMKFTNGEGANVIIDAVCIPQTLEQAIELASPAGRVVVLGFHSQPSSIAQVNITKKGLEIKGSRLHNNKFPEVIEWFNTKKVNPTSLISHRFKLEEIDKVFELIKANTEKICKIVVTL